MLLKNLEHRNTDKTKCIDLISLGKKKIPVANNLDSETWIFDYEHNASKSRCL